MHHAAVHRPLARDGEDLARRFADDGAAGPFRALAPDAARALHGAYRAAAGITGDGWGPATANLAAWHHRHRWAWDLATCPAILDRVERLLGPDVVLWAMFAWYKEPRTGKRIPWHQDASYWPIEPKKNVSAWIAFDDCTPDNGCLRLIPGTHRRDAAQVPIDDPSSWFDRGADPSTVDESQAIDAVLAPGEFMLFNEGTLHGSEPNRGDRPRLACSLRYTSPEVCLHGDRWGDDRVKAFLVRGVDRHHRNDAWIGTPPT